MFEIAKYKYKYSFSCGLEKRGGWLKYFFSYAKASSHSRVHSNLETFFKILKNCRHLLAVLNIKRLKAAILPFNR